MKIHKKDLLQWVAEKTPVRYRGEIYRAQYNGIRYFLTPIAGGVSIDFYNKGHGVMGLESNKR